jgi:hypothetical protein
MERIPLHSWEMEFSIQYHVTINSQLNDQNSRRYYIKYTIRLKLNLETMQTLIGINLLKEAAVNNTKNTIDFVYF